MIRINPLPPQVDPALLKKLAQIDPVTIVHFREWGFVNPALRPVHFGRFGETTPSASQLDWYNIAGEALTGDAWNSPTERTLQYMAASTPEHEEFNRILLVINAREQDETVTLPTHEGVDAYTLLWDSSHDDLRDSVIEHAPGTPLFVAGASMQLMRAHGAFVPRRAPRA